MHSSFATLHLMESLLARLREMGITAPTPIQAEAIPVIQAGKDVIAQSQTGTGKTLAFLLPALQNINPVLKQLQVMVLVPTRELGVQIFIEMEKLTQGSEISPQSLIGGAALSRQIEKLRLHPQLVVGTPGRILELIKLKKLSLHHVKTIVVDEVDQVFDLGSMNEVEAIFKSALRDRQIVFFSATITDGIRKVADRWMRDPVQIQVNPSQRTAETLEHLYFLSEEREKIDTMRRLVRLYNPKSAIVFINETDDMAEVVNKLQYGGLSAEPIYGEAAKQDRARVMSGFREGKFQLLIATDIAARGLDLTDVSLVINLDLPIDADHYVHRAGRTGRMGRSGTVVSILTKREQFIIDKFANQLGITFTRKEMYEGLLVNPEDNRSADAQRQRKAALKTANEGLFTDSDKREQPKANVSRIEEESTERADNRSGVRIAATKQEPRHNTGRTSSSSVDRKQKNDRERDRKNKGAPKWLKDKGPKDFGQKVIGSKGTGQKSTGPKENNKK